MRLVNTVSKFNFFLQELPNIIVTVTQIMPDNSTTVPSYSIHIEHQHTNLHRKGIDKQYCNNYTNIYTGIDVTNSAVLWENNWFIFCYCQYYNIIYTFLSDFSNYSSNVQVSYILNLLHMSCVFQLQYTSHSCTSVTSQCLFGNKLVTTVKWSKVQHLQWLQKPEIKSTRNVIVIT